MHRAQAVNNVLGVSSRAGYQPVLIHTMLCCAVQGIVDNLLYLVERYGYVPNGIRTYYLNRRYASAIPFLGDQATIS